MWDEPRPPDPPPLGWRDWALLVVLAPVAVLEGALRHDLPWPALSIAIAVGLLPTLLWRRSRPLPTVAIAFTVCGTAPLLTHGHSPDLNVMVYLVLVVYALARWGSGREIIIGWLIMIGKLGLSWVFGVAGFTGLVAGCIIISATVAAGAAVRYRTGARMREIDQIKLLERERLARDLHDTVAHHVSAMVIRAQAGLATSAARPDAATDALRVIEAEASRALAEMRSMVRVLRRNEAAELAPSPRIADLRRLGDTRTGPVVEVRFDGDIAEVPPAVATAIYRLAQESVTNARRHARRATRILVHVTADAAAVRLRVSDDGESAGLRPVAPGFGLLGMIERAELLGGRCEAGPDPGRGWTVTAVLPRTGSAT